jgi:hypothetical protein
MEQKVCSFFAHSNCLHCGERIKGAGFAVPAPINGLLHQECAHNYNFPNKWPHLYPKTYYQTNSDLNQISNYTLEQ